MLYKYGERLLYKFLTFLTCFLILLVNNPLLSFNEIITNYEPIFIPVHDKEQHLLVALRSYQYGFEKYFLVVNPNNFETSIGLQKDFIYKTKDKAKTEDSSYSKILQSTPYVKALTLYSTPPYDLQNYGIKQANKTVTGLFLTVDMCPSTKKFESDFFQNLVKNHSNIPIAIAITGLWISHHPGDFKWLVDQAKNKKLQITWVNHSFKHKYYKNLPINQNFLLLPETNIDYEILETEKRLLEKGQIPSPFFRFPGLISNEVLIKKLNQFGLIPVGSNAWLAKGEGERPSAGSIILVHGNSNEPAGIKLLSPILENKNTKWLSLNQAF